MAQPHKKLAAHSARQTLVTLLKATQALLVAYVKNTLKAKGGGFGLLLLCLAFGSIAQAQDIPSDPAQIQFEAGVQQMFANRLDEAIAIFEDLYNKTRATRVKLEWARAAFLGKRYALSRRLFDEVLAEPIPDIVRFNISVYLGEIAKLGDQTDYGFSFVSDTNPFAVAKKQQVLIYGIPFTYTPPKVQETLAGLNFYVAHSRSLTESGTVRLIAEADNTEYQGEDNNKSAVKLAVQLKSNAADNTSLRLGVDHFYQRRVLLLRQPYVGLQYRKDQLGGVFQQLQVDLRAGKNTYPDFSYVDGHTASVGVSVTKNISNNLQMGASLFFDGTTSKTESQGYNTTAANVNARFFTPFIASNTRLNYSWSNRTYKAVDELFAVTRSDRRVAISASIQPYTLKIMGLYPTLELGIEKTKSSISINSFDRTFANFTLRKNY